MWHFDNPWVNGLGVVSLFGTVLSLLCFFVAVYDHIELFRKTTTRYERLVSKMSLGVITVVFISQLSVFIFVNELMLHVLNQWMLFITFTLGTTAMQVVACILFLLRKHGKSLLSERAKDW